MRTKLNWKAVLALRLGLTLAALGAGAVMIRSEISYGQDLDRQIRMKTEEASTRVQQGELARHYRALEEPKVQAINERLLESAPPEIRNFKAFCLEEAENEHLELKSFRCERALETSNRKNSRDEKKPSKSSVKEAAPEEFQEVSFFCQGQGSYGSILRFVDKLHASKILVSVERFGIAPSATFSQYFPTNREEKPEVEPPADAHSFVLEGRILSRPLKQEAKPEPEKEK